MCNMIINRTDPDIGYPQYFTGTGYVITLPTRGKVYHIITNLVRMNVLLTHIRMYGIIDVIIIAISNT